MNFVTTSGISFRFRATPDTGATKTVISLDLVDKYQIPLTSTSDRLYVANEEEIKVEGSASLTALIQGKPITIQALATSDMKNEMLICWNDLIRIGVLAPDFPCIAYKINRTVNVQSLWDVCLKFKDVLDDGNQLRPMAGPLMHVYLRDDPTIRPSHILVARAIPIHM